MTNKYPIFKSSSNIRNDRRKIVKRDFPFLTLECGNSFRVEKNEIKFNTLRSITSVAGKKLNKRFKAVEHEDCYEVGRLE